MNASIPDLTRAHGNTLRRDRLQQKIRLGLFLASVFVSLFAISTGNAQTVSATLTSGGSASATIGSSEEFPVTFTITTNFVSNGITYFLQSDNGSGFFQITARDASASPYTDHTTSNAVAFGGTAGVLNPVNDFDLGATGSNTAAGTHTIGILTIKALNAPPGSYTIYLEGRSTVSDQFFTDVPVQATLSLTVPGASKLANISTRLRVQTDDNVLIGGFIVTGTQPKKVIIRAIGPSLPVSGALVNPTLELRDGAGNLLASNDNWRSHQQAEIIASTVAPTNDLESAIVATLPANTSSYTAIVRGVNSGTGVGLVEVYDLDTPADSQLANISTRGFVQTGDDVMIGGIILVGNTPRKVIVRAIGPSLPVPGKLADPTLEIVDQNGVMIDSNDNWRSDDEAEIIASSVPPSNDLEAAVIGTVPPGPYTAIVRGKNGATGVALVEVYGLQ